MKNSTLNLKNKVKNEEIVEKLEKDKKMIHFFTFNK